MANVNLYGAVYAHLLNKRVDFDSDTIKAMLLTNSHTPDLSAHDYVDDVVANEVSGTGYSAGGATLTGCSVTHTAANSWATARADGTAYALKDLVRPATGNGYLYECVGAGTSGTGAPTWPTTIGATVTDGGVTWSCVGRGVVVLDAADASWASATITARYAVVYDSTPGSNATNPLLFLVDFGSDVSSTAGAFTIQWSAAGIYRLFYS